MNRRLIFVILTAFSISGIGNLSLTQGQGNSSEDSPVAVIRRLYRVHDKANDPIFGKTSRGYLSAYFDKQLADLIWKDITETPKDEMPKLDFDPLYDTQDPQITNFRIGGPRIKQDQATVIVSFKNDGRTYRITFRLRKTSAGWRIQNLVYEGGQDLVKILSGVDT